MKWSKIEIIGAACFAALSLGLLLVPAIPLAGGTPHARTGEGLARELDAVNYGIDLEQLVFDLESSPVPTRIVDVRPSSAYSKWHLDGAENLSVAEVVSRIDDLVIILASIVDESAGAHRGSRSSRRRMKDRARILGVMSQV